VFIRTERSVKEFFSLYPVVSIIIIINILLWGIIDFLQLPIGRVIYSIGIGHNLSIHLFGEYWRLVTPIFLHAGFAHLIFNSFALVLFGPALELMLGRFKFIISYLIMGIAGNVGTYIINPTSNIPHLGASGAIYGLFGIYIFMIFFRKHLIDHTNAQIVRTIFIIGLVMTFLTPGINIAAHVFGFIGGFALGPIILGNAQPFAIARHRRFETTENDNEIKFNPSRWKKKFPIPKKLIINIIWIAFGILVLFGLFSKFF